MKIIIAIMSVILMLLPCEALSKERPIKITGIYTNLSYAAGPGDVSGTEIFILQGGDNNEYYLLFQDAEGGPKPPLLIKPTIYQNHIRFEVVLKGYQANGKEVSQEVINYTGTIKNNGIELEGKNTRTSYSWKEFLKRKSSYWQ